jgi:hypothetical protein
MTLDEALDVVVARTGHRRYRELCDPAHPNHLHYRELVLRLASAPAPEPPASRPQSPLEKLPLAGDLVELAAKRLGADRLVRWVAGKLGRDCGCARRQERLNELDRSLRRYLAR